MCWSALLSHGCIMPHFTCAVVLGMSIKAMSSSPSGGVTANGNTTNTNGVASLSTPSSSSRNDTTALATLSHSLCGIWEGQCYYATDPKAQPHVVAWRTVELYFMIESNRIGTINGKGQQMASDHPHPIPFLLEGTIAYPWVQLVKVNLTPQTNRQHFVLRIDDMKLTMQGEHEAGMLRLTRTLPIDLAALMASKHAASAHPTSSPSSSSFGNFGPYSHSLSSLTSSGRAPGSSPAAIGSSNNNPFGNYGHHNSISPSASALGPISLGLVSNTNGLSRSSSLSHTPSDSPRSSVGTPDDASLTTGMLSLRSFMEQLFGPDAGIKYYDKLAENEVDMEALALMDEGHLKEMGFAMGPRLKIADALAVRRRANGIAITTTAAGTPSPPASSPVAASSPVTPATAATPVAVVAVTAPSKVAATGGSGSAKRSGRGAPGF